MEGKARIKEDVREGRIDVERLVDLLAETNRRLAETTQRLAEAQQRIEELEKKVAGAGTTKFAEPFSVRAEEQRQESRGKKRPGKVRSGRKGRLTAKEKLSLAVRIEKVFPDGVPECECQLSHTRCVWRFENGVAVLVGYEVYRGPKSQYGKVPGTLGRSEFALEIVIAIAFLVYIVGLSFDKVCLLLNFFQHLKLRKSQADALMKRLSKHWEGEFERLCTLLAHSAVVHADETSWSIHSVWAFLSEQARVVFFGVHKDAATLRAILDPAMFKGIMVTDHAAVYDNFTQAQKCWAHLLRKAIKLTLVEPTNVEFRGMADELLAIYRAACRIQRDGRLGEAGRAKKVVELDDRIVELCGGTWAAELEPGEGPNNEYRLLCNELMRLMLAKELFTFVTAAPVTTPTGEVQPVSGTNNEAERTLRGAAQARKTGRTNKTPNGARRQTILVSVLESLRQYLSSFTLQTVIGEIQRWHDVGRSCFEDLARKLKLPESDGSTLDRVIPQPSG